MTFENKLDSVHLAYLGNRMDWRWALATLIRNERQPCRSCRRYSTALPPERGYRLKILSSGRCPSDATDRLSAKADLGSVA